MALREMIKSPFIQAGVKAISHSGSSKIWPQDVVSATRGREMGPWGQQGRGGGDSARRLDYDGRVENPGNLARSIP